MNSLGDGETASPASELAQGISCSLSPEDIDLLPSLPGVYMMRSAEGKVLYIGKAANLRSRVRSYFTKEGDTRFNVRFLMRHVRTVETIITTTEKEALLLENTLIKREQPRYNILLRDDKTYVSVRFNMNHPWPRAVVLRRRGGRAAREDGALYLGPYTDAASTRETLRLLQRVFPIRSCSDAVIKNRSRPCLLHSIGRCCAPCVKPVPHEEYDELVQGTILVLKGRTAEVIQKLREKMQRHSDATEFEQAAALRDRIEAIEKTTERQRVFTHDGADHDVIVCDRAGGRVAFTVFVYQNGVLVQSRPFIFKDIERDSPGLMSEFIARFYEEQRPSREILVDPMPEDAELLSEWLTERREAKCEILLPQRGEKLRLIELAHQNCLRLLDQHLAGRQSMEEINEVISERFGLEQLPDPIECYDISTIQGFATVGSMVTFRQGEPDKSRYRHFKIKSLTGMDDFGALREMLTRRFRRAVESGETLPGLVVIDGGKGQLNVASEVFKELGVSDVGLVGMAKSRVKRHGDAQIRTDERFFLPGRKNPVIFPSNSPALYLLQRLRDEAHRFGITFHRQLRSRRNLRSSLEDLPGVGRVRAGVLLRTFGSLKALREASLGEIEAARGIPAPIARIVHEFLHSPDDASLPSDAVAGSEDSDELAEEATPSDEAAVEIIADGTDEEADPAEAEGTGDERSTL